MATALEQLQQRREQLQSQLSSMPNVSSQQFLRGQVDRFRNPTNSLQSLQQRQLTTKRYQDLQSEIQSVQDQEQQLQQEQQSQKDTRSEINERIKNYQRRLNAKDPEVVQKATARIKLLQEIKTLPTETQQYLIDSGELTKLESKAIRVDKLNKILEGKQIDRLSLQEQYQTAGLTTKEAKAATDLSIATGQSVLPSVAQEYSKRGYTPEDLGTIYLPAKQLDLTKDINRLKDLGYSERKATELVLEGASQSQSLNIPNPTYGQKIEAQILEPLYQEGYYKPLSKDTGQTIQVRSPGILSPLPLALENRSLQKLNEINPIKKRTTIPPTKTGISIIDKSNDKDLNNLLYGRNIYKAKTSDIAPTLGYAIPYYGTAAYLTEFSGKALGDITKASDVPTFVSKYPLETIGAGLVVGGAGLQLAKGLKAKYYEPTLEGITTPQGKVTEFSKGPVFAGAGVITYEEVYKIPKLRQLLKKEPEIIKAPKKETFTFGGRELIRAYGETAKGEKTFGVGTIFKGETSSGIKFRGGQGFRGRVLEEVPSEFIPQESKILFGDKPQKIYEDALGIPSLSYGTEGFSGKGLAKVLARQGTKRTQRTLSIEAFGGKGADLLGTDIGVSVSRARPASKAVRTRFNENEAINVRGFGFESPITEVKVSDIVSPNQQALARIKQRGPLTFGDVIAQGLTPQLYKQPNVNTAVDKLILGAPRANLGTMSKIAFPVYSNEKEFVEPLNIKNQITSENKLTTGIKLDVGLQGTQLKSKQFQLEKELTRALERSVKSQEFSQSRKSAVNFDFDRIQDYERVQESKQKQSQISTTRFFQELIPKVPREPIKPKVPKIPKIKLSSPQQGLGISSKKARKLSQAYRLLIKRSGRYNPIGVYTKGKALLEGEKITRGTLAASFKIEPINRYLDVPDIDFRPSNIFRTYKIRQGKKIPLQNEFIQRRGTRLSSRSEVKEILGFKRTKQRKGRRLII